MSVEAAWPWRLEFTMSSAEPLSPSQDVTPFSMKVCAVAIREGPCACACTRMHFADVTVVES